MCKKVECFAYIKIFFLKINVSEQLQVENMQSHSVCDIKSVMQAVLLKHLISNGEGK